MSEGKQKLTLSVEAGIVEQAKKLGVNISELTEQVLKGYAVKDDGLDWKSYESEYMSFLKTMDPLLSRYGASVVVGDLFAKPGAKDRSFESEVRYHGPAGFSIDVFDDFFTLDQLEGNGHSLGLRNPGDVLRALVRELEEAKLRRKEQVANLRIAARIVDAIYKAETNQARQAPRVANQHGAPTESSGPAGDSKQAKRRSRPKVRNRR